VKDFYFFSMKKYFVFLFCFSFLIGCKTADLRRLNKKIDAHFGDEFYNNSFVGLFVYDPEEKDTLYLYNSRRYFTPASNTKIFTLFAALKTLPEKIPTLKYLVRNDTLYFEGLGDPSLLNPFFKDSSAIKFIDNYSHISVYLNNFNDYKYGPGWAWEDYDSYFSPERNSLPIYGNVATIHKNKKVVSVIPNFFNDSVYVEKKSSKREFNRNKFYIDSSSTDTLEIPYITSIGLSKKLLESIIKKNVDVIPKMPAGEKNTLYSISSDSLYKQMMYVSDNFIAEQILLLVSSTLSDTLNSERAIRYVTDNYLKQIEQPPRWVDGSGLSRYNLFTPESMVYVLNEMYQSISKKRLFNFFPVAGVSGTLKNSFAQESKPYLYAKSGTVSNNYNLSGYLLTKSGKTVIFSFMNNHFKNSNTETKQKMQFVIDWIRNNY